MVVQRFLCIKVFKFYYGIFFLVWVSFKIWIMFTDISNYPSPIVAAPITSSLHLHFSLLLSIFLFLLMFFFRTPGSWDSSHHLSFPRAHISSRLLSSHFSTTTTIFYYIPVLLFIFIHFLSYSYKYFKFMIIWLLFCMH